MIFTDTSYRFNAVNDPVIALNDGNNLMVTTTIKPSSGTKFSNLYPLFKRKIEKIKMPDTTANSSISLGILLKILRMKYEFSCKKVFPKNIYYI